MSRTKTSKRGFTLVELLIVIGIIAVLISILLPAMNKARQAALRATCLSNIRQCALEMRLYANLYRDKIPLGYITSDKASSNCLWYPYTWPDIDSLGKRGTYVLMGFMHHGSFMKNPRIWYCAREFTPRLTFNNPASAPDYWGTSNLWPPTANTTNGTWSAYYCRPVAYWSNPASTRANVVPSKDLSTFARLKNRAILSEGYSTSSLRRHKNGVNVAYADGSGRFVPHDAYEKNLNLWRANTGLQKGYYILNRPDQAQGGHSNAGWPESGVWVDYDRSR